MGAKPGTNEPDGQFDDQEMPTTDGQMASNGSEEIIPPKVAPPKVIPPRE